MLPPETIRGYFIDSGNMGRWRGGGVKFLGLGLRNNNSPVIAFNNTMVPVDDLMQTIVLYVVFYCYHFEFQYSSGHKKSSKNDRTQKKNSQHNIFNSGWRHTRIKTHLLHFCYRLL